MFKRKYKVLYEIKKYKESTVVATDAEEARWVIENNLANSTTDGFQIHSVEKK